MASSRTSSRNSDSHSFDPEDLKLGVDWEEVTCPICLDFPHNGVLLRCSSYDKGCRPFLCDTDHTHSNCLDRFKSAYGISSDAKVSTIIHADSGEGLQTIPKNPDGYPTCPLCRGEVTGWLVINEARLHLNRKERCCEEKLCKYVGNYLELQKHAKIKHPHARPSEVDPTRRLDWENFQQSSEIIDVLSIIQSEAPRGVVLGDYVIEYVDEESGDEYEDYPSSKGNWWTSCILCQVFENFGASRNRRRSRAIEARRSMNHLSPISSIVRSRSQHSSISSSPSDDASRTFMGIANYRYGGANDEFIERFSGATAITGGELQRRRRRPGRSRREDR